ncbi:MAG: hypothetical protein EOQ42_03040 [Mesorhizobium sp.]|nr:MAG: hypothetical protein EOQ43_08795 [Mesorhizobium sp.]RWB81221.1 MAG: hypothetical protein EOQ42_03040 [Mesorhizobium sp.]RWF79334.1 MAG: hypothetical protein EOS26_02065 [Mesorhizobium sp.]TIS68786.1 MAG: hypothetical protein E5W92_04425 [Mesorhizobium sp.]
MPLTDPIIASGFVSASHFSKVFQTIQGITPRRNSLG